MKLRHLISLFAPLAWGSAQAQIVTTGGITLSGSRGSLDGATDLSLDATAFADGLIGNGAYAPTHLVPNGNNGTYGNASSWIGGSYLGLSWGNVGQTIQSIAFGRDNFASLNDRSDGLYTLQYTTSDLSGLALPGSGNTAGIIGAAADGAGWITVGTIAITGNATRNRYDLGFSLSGVTGLRLIAPGGAAIDQFEAYTSRALAGPMTTKLTITPASGYTLGWNGNDGSNYTGNDPATVPTNLALGATAISSSDLGPELGIGYHRVLNLNDGLYGNNKSWISSTADTTNPFAGVTFSGARHVNAVAWGRDNGNNVSDGPSQQSTDRATGLYTLQSLNPDDNVSWITLGTFNYTGDDDATVGGGFTSWLRHQYSIATAGGALRTAGIRLVVPPGGFGSNAIDELEVLGTTMTWTNGAGTAKWNLNGDANFTGAADGKFLSQDTVRFTNAGAGTLTLEGSLNPTSVTVDATSNYTFGGTGSITGTGGLTKSGSGMLTLRQTHSFSGPTVVNGGTLELDFSAGSAPVGNIINNTSLTLAGTTLSLLGAANVTNSQQFNGTTFQAGAARIQFASAPANQIALNLGAITRQVGSSVNFTLPSGAASATNGVVTSTGSAGAILLVDGVAFSTVGGTDWAAQSGGGTHLVGLSSISGYTSSDANSLSGNADIASGVNTTLASGANISSLRFNQNESRTVSVGTGQIMRTGGILVTSNVATAGSSIIGGTLMGSAGKDLVIIQDSPQPFTISSVLADSISATGLTKSGSGNLILAGLNSFSGNVQVNSGSLEISSGSNGTLTGLGANLLGRSVTVGPGATLISTTTDSIDYFSTTQNLLAFKLQGIWENNPANTAGTGFQRVDNLTLQGATINDRGQHGGGYGGILMNGKVVVSGTAASTYNQLGTGSGLGVLSSTFDVNDVTGDAAADFTVNGVIRDTALGAGSLQKLGAGTMALFGATQHSGSTTITEGTLSLQGNSVGAIPNVWIGNGARLSADVASGNNRHDIAGNLTLAGGTLGGNVNYSDTNAGQFFFSNSGNQIIVHGDTQSVISSETHFSGTHTINVADGASAVDLLVTGKLSHHHLVAWGGIVKTGNGVMQLASSMDGTNSAGVAGIYGMGGIELAGGTLIFAGSTGYSAFGPGSKSGYYLADFSANSTLKWDTGNTTDVSVNSNLRIRDGVAATLHTNGNDVTLSNAIVSGGSGSLIKEGAGTLTLIGNNTYSGGTTISAGTLQLGSGGASGSVVGNISNQGTLVFKRSDDYIYGGVVSGTGGMTQAGFIVRLTAAQTYTGPTQINNGAYLVLPSTVDQGLSVSTVVTVVGGGNLDISARNQTLAGLNGNGTVYSFNGSGQTLTLNVGTGQTQTFGGALGGPFATFSLNNTGLGTQVLSGTDNFNGTTTVADGTLEIAGSGSLANTSGVTITGGTLLLGGGSSDRINNGAGIGLATNSAVIPAMTLSGTVTETVGSLTVNSGGVTVLDLGSGASVLTFANSSAVAWNGLLRIWNWSGALTGGGTDQLSFSSPTGLNAAQLSQISFVDPAGLAPGTYGATILGTGELVPVPEPGALAAGLLMLGTLTLRGRRHAAHRR